MDYGDLLYVETNVVARNSFNKLLVVHFDRLDFSGDVGGSKCDNHSSLYNTGLDTTDRDSSDTTNFVDILERKAERLVRGTSWRLDVVDCVEKGLALQCDTTLAFPGPAFIPWHAKNVKSEVVISQ